MTLSRKVALPVLLVVLLCFGALGVQALPVCQRFVTSYKTIRTRNRVSPLTAARWAAWGKDHPDFKPHARPKYKLANKEVVEKVDFACNAMPPVINTALALEPLPPLTDLLDETPDSMTPSLYNPPGVAEVAAGSTPVLPFIPPYSAAAPLPSATPIPEPSTILLVVTGAAALLIAGRLRRPALQAGY